MNHMILFMHVLVECGLVIELGTQGLAVDLLDMLSSHAPRTLLPPGIDVTSGSNSYIIG